MLRLGWGVWCAAPGAGVRWGGEGLCEVCDMSLSLRHYQRELYLTFTFNFLELLIFVLPVFQVFIARVIVM